MRRANDAALKVADAAHAHPRPFSQGLLCQAGSAPIAAQQRAKGIRRTPSRGAVRVRHMRKRFFHFWPTPSSIWRNDSTPPACDGHLLHWPEEVYHAQHAAITVSHWPPDDTEESVLGLLLHQTTITNARYGLNEAATAGVPRAAARAGRRGARP